MLSKTEITSSMLCFQDHFNNFPSEESSVVKPKLRNLISFEAKSSNLYVFNHCLIQNTKERISHINKHDPIKWLNVDVIIFAEFLKNLLQFFIW